MSRQPGNLLEVKTPHYRPTVLAKFHFHCAICGTSGTLHIHHIDKKGTTTPFRERNNDEANLIVVCVPCHRKLHKTNLTNNKRTKLIMNMRKQGLSFTSIGKILGLSQQRISQICQKCK